MSLFKSEIKERGNYYIIPNFPIYSFASSTRRHYKTTKLMHLFEAVGLQWSSTKSTIKIHKFFVPEIVYLCKKFNYPNKLINFIIDNTWMNRLSATSVPVARINSNLISANMNVTLHPYQQEFIDTYDINKYKYLLNGYILSFEQGLGKTITSLALAAALDKKQVIIFAPKNTLETVWADHVNKFFKKKKTISFSTDKEIDVSADFIICTYAAISDIIRLSTKLKAAGEELMIIVDESHNFLRIQSNRTQELIRLRELSRCTDLLLMSGTPIKALGVEMIPMMYALDSMFDEDAMQRFKMALGLNTAIATDVLRARLQIMMHRKVKEEVLKLPDKIEEVIDVIIPDGNRFTITAVRKVMVTFAEGRLKYHKERMTEYVQTFYAVLNSVEKKMRSADLKELNEYLRLVNEFRRHPVSTANPDDTAKIKWCNDYEKRVLIPLMTPEEKNRFAGVKSAVKYVHLKIQGEVIGRLLTRMRMDMTSMMIHHSDMYRRIETALKKCVIFTSYVESAEAAHQWALENKLSPVLIYGKNVNETGSIVKKFMGDNDINPLIATTQTMATGVTLTSANTVFFLNKPWRHTEYVQASDRVHRIGQDTTCYIYSLLLKTGDAPNLSTKAEDVINFSKDMFIAIVGDGRSDDYS